MRVCGQDHLSRAPLKTIFFPSQLLRRSYEGPWFLAETKQSEFLAVPFNPLNFVALAIIRVYRVISERVWAFCFYFRLLFEVDAFYQL